MENPEMMNSIMNSPMFKSMINNPEMLNSMLMSNPQTKALLEKNPHLHQALNDPEMINSMMKAYSSQAASDQMNYQNDIALRQLDHTGQYPKIESMFNNINDAFDNWPDPFEAGANNSASAAALGTSELKFSIGHNHLLVLICLGEFSVVVLS